MPYDFLACPECGAKVKNYLNPIPTVDIIIELENGIVLIERKNEPTGWAIPGGFVDYGESLEDAASREACEETSLTISGLRLVGCYSEPGRDRRHHTISTVFAAIGTGTPRAADDAAHLKVFSLDSIPEKLCFDHKKILEDYIRLKKSGVL
jgi:8-oxo-dGTP diphosphatase